MRKISFLIVLCLTAFSFILVRADEVSKTEASKVAVNFALSRLSGQENDFKKNGIETELLDVPFYSKYNHLHIFKFINRNGFVIVSGDDAAFPVLGYSFDKNISQEQIVLGFNQILSDYNSQIGNLIENHIKADEGIQEKWAQYKTGNRSTKV